MFNLKHWQIANHRKSFIRVSKQATVVRRIAILDDDDGDDE